jgi:hypothetical protein
MRNLRTWLCTATAAVVLLVLFIGGAPLAQASDREVDVTDFKVSDVVFDKDGCKNMQVTLKGTAWEEVDFDYMWLYTDVSRSGYLVDTLSFPEGETEDSAFICSWNGLGKYKVGPTEVTGYTYDDDRFSFIDQTSKSFYVRGTAKTSISAKRSGSKVTLSAKATYYHPDSFSYRSHSPKGAKFQVKSGSKWKTVKTVSLSKGRASYSFKKSAKARYRVVLPQTSTVTAATSKSVSK